MPWGVAAAAIGAAGSVYSANKGAKAAANSTSQQQMDPRAAEVFFGTGAGQPGLFQNWAGLNTQGQNAGSQAIGQASSNYLQGISADDITRIRNSSYGLMQPKDTPYATNPLWNTATTVNAPAQNNIDLTGSYKNLLGGGDTTALMNSLKAGNALTNQQLQQNQASLTDNLQRNVLPSIRSGAIAAGQYGGSRQGIAEGNAISDFTKQLNDSSTQIGLANSANTAGQLANAYESGQNRALSATQGLGAQQYGVASQNAALNQASQFANQSMNTNLMLANQQAELQNRSQNNQAALAGSGQLSGLLGQLYGYNQNNQNFDVNRAQQLSGILAPYAGANGTTVNSSPYYSNTAGNAIGGAAAGLSLWQQFGGSFGGAGASSGAPSNALF